MTVAEIARVVWEAYGRAPNEFALDHQPTFPVDLWRRWPDVSKAREVLGCEAQTPVGEGFGRTVRWLRETTHATA